MAKRSKRRSRKRSNPTAQQWGIAAAATVAVAAAGYGGYRYFARRRKTDEALPGLEGVGEPGQITCEIGPDYPGFVTAQDGACVPSGTTPAGIYVDRACQDFVFVSGDDGPQVDNLELLIGAMAIQSKALNAPSAEPLVASIGFLHKFWPNCTWPPTADSPPRLIHMFEALTLLIARSIIKNGGRVLGTKSDTVVDDLVADRMSQLGLPEFDLEIVPELAEWIDSDGSDGLSASDELGSEPSEIAVLKQKLCDAPGDFTAFEKIKFINEVISPLLENRIGNLGPDPSLQALDAMFSNIAFTVTQKCPVVKRLEARKLAKKFAHDLWVQRYNNGEGIVTDVPTPPPVVPPLAPVDGYQSPKLPDCLIDPFLRTQTQTSTRSWWKSYAPVEIKLFEFAGKWANCKDYDLNVGVCLQVVDSDKPYGHLSNYAPNFPGYLDQFAIFNSEGSPITWTQFRSPPTYKRQIHARVKLVLGNVEISQQSDTTGTPIGNQVDPCAGAPSHWPIPAVDHFNIYGSDGQYHEWRAEPQITLVKKGKAVFLQIRYTGVPAFAASEGSGQGSSVGMFFDSNLKLQVHSVTTGRTP